MKQIKYSVILLALLAFSCDVWQPGIIEDLIFNEGSQWIERDAVEDPTELVDGICCNDSRPYPLPADSTILGVINPVGDVDYFQVVVDQGSIAQQVVFIGESPSLELALFDSTLARFEPTLDTLIYGNGEAELSAVLVGAGQTFFIQANGGIDEDTGSYNLTWQPLQISAQLAFDANLDLTPWARGMERTIKWDQSLIGSVNISLIRGAVVIAHLDRYYSSSTFQWAPSQDIEPGSGYRLIISLSSSPNIVDITDEFQIF